MQSGLKWLLLGLFLLVMAVIQFIPGEASSTKPVKPDTQPVKPDTQPVKPVAEPSGL